MGLLEGNDREYYKGNDHGNYQFTSLEDIITQFEIAYVGEDKIISKVRRADIAFHAQRALAELSFDTLKSTKAHEIILPPSLTMILPRDYVNYTKISWSDNSGIKHPLYPTSATSNPFNIKQEEDGSYSFLALEELVENPNFDLALNETWEFTNAGKILGPWQGQYIYQKTIGGVVTDLYDVNYKKDKVRINNNQLEFSSHWNADFGVLGWGRHYGAWQEVDVKGLDFVDLAAFGSSAPQIQDNVDVACLPGVLRIGISSVSPQARAEELGLSDAGSSTPDSVTNGKYSIHDNTDHLDLGYVEWIDGTSSEKGLQEVNVSSYDVIYVWIQSKSPWTSYSINSFTSLANPEYNASQLPPLIPHNTPYSNFKAGQGFNAGPGYSSPASPNSSTFIDPSVNTIDSITLTSSTEPNTLRGTADRKSTTQKNFSSSTPSSVQDDYIDDNYWPVDGSRYGLDAQQAQVNGSYYIDNRLGKVNFSSNISGKTVILDYISDSLGTDEEMLVHKFAEEAIYKWIAHAILSTRANTQEYIVQRFKKERFAAIRTAKLRLSNIKLEELTQILRGKSKQIKH